MDKLIVANLKMNLNFNDIVNYKKIIEESNIQNFIIAPSSIYLNAMQSSKYSWCAQNGYYVDYGAYTGEISFLQLNHLNVKYCLIGHSERRNIFNEDYELISKKAASCVKNNIIPILCVGENKNERDKGNTLNVIDRQLECVKNLDNVIIAYEPVWAIGSGCVPNVSDIERVHLHIKNVLNSNVKILYGGSVNLSNIKEICSNNVVDGVLIGSASIDPNQIIKMYNELKKV